MNTHDTDTTQGYDPKDRDLINALDALAHDDRSAPDQGFESRLLDHIAGTVAPEPVVLRTRRSRFWALQGAAAAAVVLGVGTTLVLQSGIPQPVGPEQSIESQIATLEDDLDSLDLLASFSDSLETRIAEVGLLTDQVDTELLMPSVFLELEGTDAGAEGSL